ncbi:hypothetical protein NM208_g9953 [Fusarium decemcellulare]|uniref:Uncharacterized protein n=1 Tax=Fusarium decemcellulare TaxID=57161 RepID=A0ACC1RZP1_9HYPO|nr:hypothetical protein NM208_g9953 [Fusarium decemcellulare]
MASESPNPAWHPATMPNNSDSVSSTEAPADAAQATSSTTEPAVQPNESTAQNTESRHEHKSSEGGDAANAWLSQDGDDAGDSWLASADAAPQQSQDEELPSEAAPEQPETQTASPSKAPTSQHSSSMSFARTVSHEITFGDDDDGDWNLSRTDTDPFKFMPPSDRTNSFPVVPPMHSSPETPDQHPLPSNQALDVLEETEKDADAEEQEYQQQGASNGLDTPRRGHSSSVSIGGDLKSPEGQASDERYEEGLPLISQPVEETTEQPSSEATGAFADSFNDESATGDDFFSQAQQPTTNATSDEQHIPSLERKSTMQVMDSTNTGAFSRQSTIEETPEEDEELTQAEQPATNQAGTSGKEDLSSKWEQAFADDEDDDFLLEDNATGDKQVDPAAFFGSDDEASGI